MLHRNINRPHPPIGRSGRRGARHDVSQPDPSRRAKAIIAVGAIHAVLAYGLVTGLGGVIRDPFAPPLVGTQIPLPPLPPPPEPTPEDPVLPTVQDPVAPLPPIPLPQPGPARDPFDPDAAVLPEVPGVPNPGPTASPPRPAPSFTPTLARPANRPSSWISNNDYPRRPLVAGAEGTARYRLIVGTNGRVSSCEITHSTGNAQLDQATCRLIAQRARFEPATGQDGAKVLGAYSGTVRWNIPE